MASDRVDFVLNHIRHLAAKSRNDDSASDAVLLRRYVDSRCEQAFETLVRRHAAMVFNVCRCIVSNRQDAEDAFQGTFLVLAQKPDSIRKRNAVASWLHGVASRLAQKVRRRRVREPLQTTDGLDFFTARPLDDVSVREARSILHEELARLPEKNRAPILLCHLEGLTQDEAAARLDWTLGTLRGRLLRGRELLCKALKIRGLSLSIPLLSCALAQSKSQAAILRTLLPNTLDAAIAVRNGQPIASSTVAELAQGMIANMMRNKLLLFAASAAAVVILGCGAALLAQKVLSPDGEGRTPTDVSENDPDRKKGKTEIRVDRDGNALPVGALVRLGTLRMRHSGAALAFSPDGKYVASGGQTGEVMLWDFAKRRKVRQFLGRKKGGVTALAFAPNGETLAGVDPYGFICVWNVKSGKNLHNLAGHKGQATRIAYSPDGRILASGGSDKVVRLWDSATLRRLGEFTKHTSGIRDLRFSPDGKMAASADYGKNAWIWDVATGKAIRKLKACRSLCFSPDGKSIVADNGSDACLWSVATGKLLRSFAGHKYQISSVVFAANGDKFATGSDDHTIRVWDVATGKEIHRLEGHADAVAVSGLVFSPDGRTLASGSYEATVRLWDVKTGKGLTGLGGHQGRVVSAAFAPDGKTIATGSWDGTARLWQAATGKTLAQFKHRGKATSVAFTPDGNNVVSVGNALYTDNIANYVVWDAVTGKPKLTRSGDRAVLSPDGKLIAITTYNVLKLADRVSGKIIREFRGHQSMIDDFTFSPDGRTLASVCTGASFGAARFGQKYDKESIWLWDVATGKVRLKFGGLRGVGCAAFSADGRTLATTSFSSGGVDLWETVTGKQRARLDGHHGDIFAITFSHDGKMLASSGMDRTARLRRMPGGDEIACLRGHQSWVLAVAFAPDGKKLVTGSLDTTGLVWDLSRYRSKPATHNLDPKSLDSSWADLAGDDAVKAFQAVQKLVDAADQAVSFLRTKLRPTPAPDEKKLADLISKLGDNNFQAREEATKQLEKLGDLAIGALRAKLKAKPVLEVQRRIQAILSKLENSYRLRELRAVEILEYIGTSEAEALLQHLAKGVPASRQTKEARSSLIRLSR